MVRSPSEPLIDDQEIQQIRDRLFLLKNKKTTRPTVRNTRLAPLSKVPQVKREQVEEV